MKKQLFSCTERSLIILFISVFVLIFPECIKSQILQDKWIECNTQGCKILDPYYSEGVRVTWDGPCVNGKANGFGKLLKYKNGEYESTYEGEYKNGVREGRGTFTHADGSVAKGNFVNGQLVGYGSRVLEGDGKYEGEFFNYRQHGKGAFYYPNGSKFEGSFVSDRVYTGKLTNYDGSVTYFQRGIAVDKITEKPSGYRPELGKQVREYFDANRNRCKPKDAAYYRLVTYKSDNQPVGEVRDYFITGELQSLFTCPYLDYDDEGMNFHEGAATWYFRNGQIQQQRFYYNNRLNGTNTYYFEDGQKMAEVEYYHSLLNGRHTQWYKNGKIKMVALYETGELYKSKYMEFDETGAGAMVYVENFNKNKDVWLEKGVGFETYLDESNKVVLKTENNQTIGIKNYISIEQESDYSIECIVHKKKGKGIEGYGLLFGFNDWNNYINFLISEYGTYKIYGIFEGMEIKIKDWTATKSINTGNQRNLLKVFKFNDEFIFSINSQVVERVSSKSLRGNYCGLNVNGTGEYVLENLIVKEFLSEDSESKFLESLNEPDNEWSGNGSGFFINEKGYVATNFHVVEGAKEIQVEYTQKGTKYSYSAEVVITDKLNDLAILKIKDPAFKSLPSIPYVFTTSTKDVGTNVFALGYPMANVMGEEIKFTDGKISSKTGIQGDVTVYQISVPIQPGNSGGPLFDNNGNLIGITAARLNKERFDSENVNYAIKSSYLKNLVDVMSASVALPSYHEIQNKSLTEKIKILSEFIPLIKVKD